MAPERFAQVSNSDSTVEQVGFLALTNFRNHFLPVLAVGPNLQGRLAFCPEDLIAVQVIMPGSSGQQVAQQKARPLSACSHQRKTYTAEHVSIAPFYLDKSFFVTPVACSCMSSRYLTPDLPKCTGCLLLLLQQCPLDCCSGAGR